MWKALPILLITAILAVTLFASVIRLIALIAMIVVLTVTALTFAGLATWALIGHFRDRSAVTTGQASAPPRVQSVVPTGHTLAAATKPAAGFAEIALLGRLLSKTEQRIARQFADAVADGQDLSAINELISKVLRDHDT
jgi:hypothetical protein